MRTVVTSAWRLGPLDARVSLCRFPTVAPGPGGGSTILYAMRAAARSYAHHHPINSTSPPIAFLSWAVDGSTHTHHRCRRRLTIEQRIPLIVRAIEEVAPDVVALQDSTAALAAALCSGTPAPCSDDRMTTSKGFVLHEKPPAFLPETGPPAGTAQPPLEGERANEDGALPSPLSEPSAPHAVRYQLIGSARNGRCGEVQLFIRSTSPWTARLLPTGSGVTAELSCSPDGGSPLKKEGKAPGDPAGATPSVAPVRCIVSTTDLSYRGKSLAVGGERLNSAEVSCDGSPFTLTTPGSGVRVPRVKGQLDPHREVALHFIAQATRPDVLLVNSFLGQAETMPGYSDAWVLAGAPAAQERTTDTFRRRRGRGDTNYFYFVPSPGVSRTLEHGKHYVDAGNPDATAQGTAGTGQTELSIDAPQMGTEVPLTASCGEKGKWVTSSGDHLLQSETATVPPSTSSTRAPYEVDQWVACHLDAPHHRETMGVPEVAGRYQRCFFRYNNRPSRTHSRQFPFIKRYRRCRVLVLRPFVSVPMGPVEASWHAHRKMRGKGPDDAAAIPDEVRCSLSDQYPLLTLLS